MRADRQALGVEGRCAGQHAEALPQQVQRQAGTGFVARGDRAQHALLVDFVVLDQAQFGEMQAAGDLLADGRRAADTGQGAFQTAEELRDQVGAVLSHQAQGVEIVLLPAGIGGLVGLAEQLLLELAEHPLQRPRHFIGDQRVEPFQRAPHPSRQLLRRQGLG